MVFIPIVGKGDIYRAQVRLGATQLLSCMMFIILVHVIFINQIFIHLSILVLWCLLESVKRGFKLFNFFI